MLQICVSNSWQVVCDDYWDCNDALVACRQLGYNGTGTVLVIHSTYNSTLVRDVNFITVSSFVHPNDIHSGPTTY